MSSQLKERTDQILKNILVEANSLCKLSKTSALAKCLALKTDIQQLINLTDAQALQVQKQAEKKVEELISAEKQINTKLQERKKKEDELKSLEQMLTSLRKKLSILDDDIRKMNSEITSLNLKIEEEETKRTDALTDLIPGVGFFGGLITGRFERMIPFHSQVSGLASVITQDKENADRRVRLKKSEKIDLNRQLQTNEETKEKSLNHKVNMQNEIEVLRQCIKTKEEEKKKLGRNLTALKNASQKLKFIVQQQKLMKGDIGVITLLIQENELEGEVRDFVKQLESVQQSSRAIAYN